MRSGFAQEGKSLRAKLCCKEAEHLYPWIYYHMDLRYKYQRAARYPWLPVASDPPEPE